MSKEAFSLKSCREVLTQGEFLAVVTSCECELFLIAFWHDYMGKSVDEIAAEYDLSLADIHTALACYFDHQVDEIDREIEEKSENFIRIMRRACEHPGLDR